MKKIYIVGSILAVLMVSGCTQETQNKLGRAIQNWTGTDGVLEVYAGDKLVKRFMKIDKLSTAVSTGGDANRPYRYGYGILDTNLDGVAGKDEKRVYFEFSDYSTSYIFYESPTGK
jgi:outer membrane murein-binding lipoprotein Lpp